MARPELGTKRVDPENGRKFYDLGKNPIVSPYTGTSYALSFFDPPASAPSRRAAPQYTHREEQAVEAVETDEDDAEDEEISLTNIEDDENDAAKLPSDDVDGDGDDEASDDDDDGDDGRILAIDEDDDADLSDIARPRDEE
ncbi:TIGR02300 family protein [Antarcticirhabdus aurantiaca]|uniref:TIGR02300 family protein n=1 Tax=Antarcticirhabdus aurantiaca TaxID=2606717 RepID=A0ACD4NNA4_9HYPH|nr:TIGR02300 family protein [Antarcticirhabdus aurantiaca]WAJ28247.1 TIGR02300 family protein [Jeongeuplla avenae]